MNIRFYSLLVCIFLLLAGFIALEVNAQELTSKEIEPAPFDADMADFLFFDSYLAGQSLQSSIDIITSDYELYYVSFAQFNESLKFHLSYENQRLSGWYLRERNQVSFDVSAQIGQRINQKIAIKPYHWVEYEGDLYLSTIALKDWFEIDTDIRANKLLINFRPKEEHPMIARLKRQEKHKLRELRMSHEAHFPTIADSYQPFTIPAFDINFSPSWNKSQGWQKRLNVSSNADILWHSAALQYSKTDSNQSGRLTLSREGEWQGMPFYYQFGDVYGVSNPFLSSGLGRGVMFGRSEQTSQERNTRRFEGPAPDGWEAELYRGNTAFAYQIVEGGFYRFENIPTNSGRNSFYVLLYGPTGEQQRIDYEFNTSKMIVAEGDWFPEFSWQQAGRSVLFDKATTQKDTFSAKVHYGLSNKSSLSLGYIQQSSKPLTTPNTSTETVPDITRLTATMSGYTTRMRYHIDVGYDEFTDELGYNLDTSWLFNDFDIQLNYKDLSRIQPNAKPSTTISYTPFEPSIDHSLSLSLSQSTTGWKQNWSANIGWKDEQWQLSASAEYQPGEGSNLTTQAGWRIEGHQLQLQNAFSITPDAEITATRFSHRMKLGSVSLQTGINANWQQHSLQYSLSLSKKFDWFRFGAQLSTDDKDSYRVGLNLSFSTELYPEIKWPSAQSSKQNATIFASVYIDENYNGQRDSSEQKLPNVRFKGRNHWRNTPTSTTHDARLTKASSRSAQKVQLDPLSLEDPFLYTPHETLLVNSHPGGENSVSFRLIPVTEMEGEVLVQKCPELEGNNTLTQQDAPEIPLKGVGAVPLRLTRADGSTKQSLYTEFDGFFLLEKIIPDTYQLSIEPSFISKKNLQDFTPLTIEVTKDSMLDVIALDPIVLTEKCQS